MDHLASAEFSEPRGDLRVPRGAMLHEEDYRRVRAHLVCAPGAKLFDAAWRRNPWLRHTHYTKACDFLLEVVDRVEARLTECPEALVALSAQLVLRYLSCTSVEKAEMESLARVCLTLVSKLTERMYVPLSDAYEAERSDKEARRPELELRVVQTLDWRIILLTPYSLRSVALEAMCALPLPAPPTDGQRVAARKLLDVFLYLGVRDASYLALDDQAAALAAAAELASSKALGTESTDHLPALCAALGVADLAAARQMREIMRLTVGGAPSGTPSLEKAEAGADSPATITAALGAVSPAPGVAASPGPRRSVDM